LHWLWDGELGSITQTQAFFRIVPTQKEYWLTVVLGTAASLLSSTIVRPLFRAPRSELGVQGWHIFGSFDIGEICKRSG
jgi:hypothetical protein